MKVLGLGGSSHDFSACLVIDGEVKVAIEEERITRKKHSINSANSLFRCHAVDYCLDYEKLKIEDIDIIVGNDIIDPRYYAKYNEKIKLMNHHLSHAASAYFCSNFDESAVLVIDGFGSLLEGNQHETITTYFGKDNKLEKIECIKGRVDRTKENPLFENSLGAFYLTVTRAIGFDFLQEGKTMGLSAYGDDSLVEEFYKFYSYRNNEFKITFEDMQNLEKYIEKRLFNLEGDEAFRIKANIAYALQKHLEKIIVIICNNLYEKTKCDKLSLAGGVALNSVANFKILQKTPFKQIFIQAGAGDNGTAIGSALYEFHNNSGNSYKKNNRLFSPYLGKEYSHEEISVSVQESGLNFKFFKSNEINKITAQLISEGNIIGIFNGKSEFGPRALGNRSILADPRDPSMKDSINKRIKHREDFRPFAPAILEEKQSQYFDMLHESYYMLMVPQVHKEKSKIIPSVTHVDGSGRVQTVSKLLNPNFHSIITEFEKITNVPIVLNTSFNDNGEPIVESPKDAINCFKSIDLDYLVIGNYLIYK